MRNDVQFPCTVRQYAESVGRSQSYVRDRIKRGELKIDPEAKVALIVGGYSCPTYRCSETPDMFPETLVRA
jgi:hypothetical protein